MRNVLVLGSAAIAAVAFVSSGGALAQQPGVIIGSWSGVVDQPDALEAPQYTVSADIDTDRDGSPVATVEYGALQCSGVWADATWTGSSWRLHETITDGRQTCIPHSIVELVPQSGLINMRFFVDGETQPMATGRLSQQRGVE